MRICALAAIFACSGAGSAFAGSGGSPGSGGARFVATPHIAAVSCVSSCTRRGAVKSGGRVRLRGAQLAGVSKVIFTGGRGTRDDVTVDVKPVSDRSLPVPVPMGARTGPLVAWAGKRAHARTRAALKILPAAAPTPNPQLTPVPGPADPGAPVLETATSRSVFAIDQRGGVTFSFRVDSGVSAASLELTLVRLDDGAAVETFAPAAPASGTIVRVFWDGLVDGKPAVAGRYAFRLVATSAGGAKATNAAPGDAQRDAFDLRPALFPIMGAHSYGGPGNRFGAARSGHTHQGQDVLAACGTPLRAARGGVVKANHYQAAAGNYLVIDGQNTGVDYAYMHLAAPSPYGVGDRVHTGDQIGVVGETGDATACHLHFEEWRAPGWYSGGSPFDPLPDLKAWDAYS